MPGAIAGRRGGELKQRETGATGRLEHAKYLSNTKHTSNGEHRQHHDDQKEAEEGVDER